MIGKFLMVAAALVLAAGCATTDETITYNYRNPLIRFTNNGLKFRDEFVTPRQAMELMEKHRIPKGATIHLLVDDDYRDDRAIWVFQRNYLARAGYTKSVRVRNMEPEVKVIKHDDRHPRAQPRPQIRYKGSKE